MCDCFHMMLPTWSEAPGSASGRQLQPEEPDAETAEDQSVTEGSVDEIIRPRPQGSSPVYEYVTEGAGFGLPSTQEAMEGTLKTKVEAGASGYLVTGGGDQGIFVKQVLKESSAAKLFSLREGDQLLSTTIFFDDIKYEDALKILQYSEPYKVQFTVRRQLPAWEDEEGASGGAPRGSRGSKKQDQDIAEGRTETPTETLQEDGDQERLISKPREGRGRQPQRERLSWPKFQALKSKRGPGPRRSHSSSEASERGDVPDLSPTSTDTEAQLPEAGPGRQRKKSFPNLRFRVGSGKGLSGRGAHGGTVQAGVLVETGPRDSGREASRAAAHGGREDRTAGVPEAAEPPTEPGLPTEGAPGEGAGPAPRPRRKTKEAKDRGETVPQGNAGLGPAPGQSRKGAGEGTQSLELGIARLSLQDSADQGIHQNHQPEFHVRIPTLKTPKFGLYKEKVLEKEGAATALQQGPRQRRVSAEGTEAKGEDAGEAEKHRPRQPPVHPPAQEGGATEEDAAQKRDEDSKGGGPHTDEKEGKMKMLRFKLPSFGWSPAKEAKGDKATQLQETEKEKESSITVETLETDVKGQGGLERDSKFQMPRFKMPSFRVSAPSKSVQAAVEVSVPKAQAEVTLTSVQADVKTSDLRIEQLSAELEVKATEVGVKLPEGHHPKAEPKEAVAGIGLKGHLPKVQMPSIKAPQVDIKGPKLDLKDAKGEVTAHDVEVSLPSVEVDTQAAGTKLEGDMSLGDKEVAARDSKFKMPKFKMPSFGMSAPSKSVQAAMEVSVPKAQAEVTRPSVQADVKTSDFSIELPSSKLEVKAAEVGLKLPEGHLPEVEPTEAAAVIGLKGHLSKVQMPSIKVPKVDIKAPQVDIKGPKLDLKDAKGEVTTPDMQVSLPSVEVDTQAAGIMLAGDVSLGDKEVATRDSKFKMPKFKMPSFGVSAPSKSVQAAMEVSVPKAQAEVTLPSVQADVKTSDISIELPSTELDVKAAEVGVKLPEGHLPEAEMKEAVAGIGLKGHLPKVQMPSIKVPKVDIKGPQVDIKGPKLELQDAKGEVTTPDVEVSLPSVEVDSQVADSKLAGKVSLGDKEVAARDSKFKMPKFKMPSFGLSAPSKSVEASLEGSGLKTQAEVTLHSVQGDIKTSDLSIELPSAELDVKAAEVGVKLPEGHLPEAEPKEVAAGIGLKGHLPKVQMPSIKVPKVDIKGPKLDLKEAKGEVTVPDVEVSLPSVEVDTKAAGIMLAGDVSLGDKEVAARDSKFKMPKFKMPSVGVSAPSKSVKATVEVSVPKAQAKVTRPSVQADVKTSDLSIELPSSKLEVKAAEVGLKLPEGHLLEAESTKAAAEIGLKGHLSKVQMPSIKVPMVDIKGPKLDLKDPKSEVTTPYVEVSLPSVEVDTQAAGTKLEGDVSLGDKEVAARDSKFKMPQFKMPSFGVSSPSKSAEASLDGSGPKDQAEVTLPSVQADVKISDLSIELPSTELDVKAAEVGLKLPEGHLPEAEPTEAAAEIGLKGHLSKVQMPSIKVPKVDIKGPKLDLKDAKSEVTVPDVEVSLPSVEVDSQAADIMLAGDVSLGDKEVAVTDSKFKMPKFKMPSFGVSAPSKSVEASLEGSGLKTQAEVTLPSVQGDVKTSDLSIELPSAKLDVKAAEVGLKLPEGHLPEAEPTEAAAGIGLKGHLSKVQMPSIKVPKVDIKGPKLDLKEAKGEVTVPDVEVSLPSMEVDTKAAGIMLAGDVSLGDKEVAARDSKFKMPKFKMPSVGVSVPSKSVKAAMEVSVPKAQAKVTRPSVQADVKTSDLSIELPSSKLEVKAAEVGLKLPGGHLSEAESTEAAAGIGLKGHLSKVQMPSIKVPKVDLKGPKLDLQDAKGEVTTPDVEVSLPSVEVDSQVADCKLVGDVSLGDKEVAVTDSKFKMPKFKMPSFGVSAPSKSVEASLEGSGLKTQAEVTLPSVQGDVKTSDLSIQLPSAELEVKAAEVGLKLPEGHLPEVEPKEAAAGIGLKGHLSKVQMPSIKVPKVDLKGPKLDLKDAKGEVTTPDMEVSLPSVEVDTQAAGTKLEGDVSLGDKEVATRDSKFKMPKFKMPSFGVSAPSKSVQAAMEVSVPKAQAEVTLPSVQADVKTSVLSIEQPSTELDVKAAEVGVKLPEGQLPEVEPKEAVAGIGLKGHLSKVQMPSIKVPKVDIKAPQVDIKGPKLDLRDAKGEVTTPDMEVSLPSVEVDTKAAGIMLAGDVSLGDKEVAARDSKFKMPKFKMPSFGASVPSKSVQAAMEVSVPKAQAKVTLPSMQADVKNSVSIELPSTELDVKAAEVGMKLPEGHLPEAEMKEAVAGIGLKGHLPKVQMPSIKVPKVDIKGPQVEIKGPKLDLKDAKGEVTTPDMEVSLPSVEVDTKAADIMLAGDVSLGDKEVAARDSKFKMPKFKMPSVGVSAPSKSVKATAEVSVHKAQAKVTQPSVQADVKTSDLSIELPSSKLEVKATEVGLKLLEGHLPEVEPTEAAAVIGLKGHLSKVQMPSIKVPKVDLKGPKLDRQDAKGEVTTPNVEVLLPSVEVDTQAAGTKLESDVSLGDKEVAAKDSKFKMPKCKMPSFGVLAPSKSVEAALEESVPNVQAQVTLSSVQADVKTSALSIELPSTELEVKGAKVGVKLPEGHLLRAEPREVALGIALKGHLPKLEKPSIKVPKVDIEGPKLDLKDAKGEVLTKYQVTLPGAAVSPGLPLEAAPCSQNDAYLPSSESSASLPTQERVAASQTDSPAGPVDPMFLASYGRVSFPKFHPPKFGFSVPEAADAEVEAGPGGCAPSLSTTGPARGLDSTAVPRSAWPSAVAAGESPAKDTERGGKDSPLKMPWIKLPSFSWSPEKGAVPPEDPECSLDDAEIGVAVDTGHKGVPPGCPVSAVEVAVDALPEKDGEESGVGSPGCAVLEHAPLTGLTPEGGPGLPRGDPAAPRSRPPAGGGAPEGADVDPHLPQAHAPLLDFVRPDLRPSKAKVGGSSSAGGPPSPGHSSQGHGLRDGPASQPLGEAMAPSVGDPQQPSCSPADVDAPAVESVASQGGWFRMPALRLPSLRRPARERGAAGARGAPVPAPAASTLREGESPAPVRGQGIPGSEVEEAMSLQPPEAGADEAAAELASHADADVLKRGPEDKRSELHLSPAGAPAAGLSPSEARVRPGEGSLPLQMPSGRLSGTQAPPAGPAGPGLAAGQGRAEEWPSQPEGPIKLKASRTDGPSQVSVVNMGQPWEGSVVTVRLPRLSVPRFAFPDPSSEADVFIPAVTEVQCPGSSLAHALHEGSPGVWGASILRAGAGTPGGQPVALGFSPEASPISEVRVHVQRAQGEGPEVAVHSRATAELADLSGPEAISTQVVRQLEIPASEIQTASYGFSLLKVKVPEPRTRVSVRDSRLRDGLQEASQQAAPGAEPASGGPQPDTTGPSEVISPSVDVPGQPTFTPKVHSGRQGADSCCDKAEGAEVLAFPPKEAGGEAATSRAEEGSAPGEKPGGRRSGLFRFWLPNIGFSSSAEEPRADSKGEARAAAALQTQPGARPEAELPRKPQRAGWLRFPTLGLSSSPTKKSESSEDEAALAEQNAQEQAVTFFDAPESFSPEGEGAGGPAETAGARAMATSMARTGLVLLEQDPEGGMHLHPGPPQSEDRQTDERRPSEAPTVRTRVSTLIHSTESEAEVPESGGAPPSHSPPEVGPQTRRPPRASAAEAAPGRPTRPQPHAGSCAPDGLG
uniref:Protein AHNAK2 isoform X3 n=1 Tax=Tursiops truncatus TaxID=9739 RepID=A0A6J3QW82_TURTR|nr:protein AHNAK2 isoform X3 [Tursiops truncatus]